MKKYPRFFVFHLSLNKSKFYIVVREKHGVAKFVNCNFKNNDNDNLGFYPILESDIEKLIQDQGHLYKEVTMAELVLFCNL